MNEQHLKICQGYELITKHFFDIAERYRKAGFTEESELYIDVAQRFQIIRDKYRKLIKR